MAYELLWAVALRALQDFHLNPSISQSGTPGSAGEADCAVLMVPIKPLTHRRTQTFPLLSKKKKYSAVHSGGLAFNMYPRPH